MGYLLATDLADYLVSKAFLSAPLTKPPANWSLTRLKKANH